MNTCRRSLLVLCCSVPLMAQAPPRLAVGEGLRYDPVRGETLTWNLAGGAGHGFLLAADPSPGPVQVLGVRLDLGLSSGFGVLAVGVLSPSGSAAGALALRVPLAAVGSPLFAQAVELSGSAPNGLFLASNPEAAVVYDAPFAVVEGFDEPYMSSFTGTFDGGSRFQLRGGPVRRRLHETIDPQGAPFFQPVPGPLNHFGSRAQMVFRPRDVGSFGEEEALVAVHWRPFLPVVTETFDQIEILATHTLVTPDYRIDPWTALPMFPNSGLAPTFANNYAAAPQSLFTGRYDVLAADLRPDGFLPYPALQPFAYDGQRSLLLEFRFTPNTARGATRNGQHVRVMVLSDPMPGARVVAEGSYANNVVVQPTVAQGRADNAMVDYLLEFARVKTWALSGWYQATAPNTDWLTPIVVAHTPPGTSVQVEYRGSAFNGSNPTAWSPTPDVADGLGWLQFRVTFAGDIASGAVPAIDLVVVPYR